jgi:hypothetical protein
MSFETTAQAALGFALSTLKNMNAKFNISLPDGTVYSIGSDGNLVKRKAMQRTAYKHMYIDRLESMQPGTDRTFTIPEGVDINAMRSSISSSCCDMWEAKSFSTKIVNGKIIVWRFKTNDVMEMASA